MTSINAEKNMEVSKNSSFIYKVYKIGPISNISKEKLEPGAKVEDWALVVRCRRDTVQKIVVLPIYFYLTKYW